MVGAIQQKCLEDLGVTGHETRAQAWQVGALGQAVEYHAAFEIFTTQVYAGAQQADGRCLLVEVQFAVALVGGNHEVMFVSQGDQFFQGVEGDQRARRVAR